MKFLIVVLALLSISLALPPQPIAIEWKDIDEIQDEDDFEANGWQDLDDEVDAEENEHEATGRVEDDDYYDENDFEAHEWQDLYDEEDAEENEHEATGRDEYDDSYEYDDKEEIELDEYEQKLYEKSMQD